jgi:hypothetical protein
MDESGIKALRAKGDAQRVILIALEQRLYSEALGAAIRDYRPRSNVKIVDPGALGPAVGRLVPDLVLCDQPVHDGIAERLAWIEYRPYTASRATLHVRDQRFELDVSGLADLLSVVDKAEDLL